MIAETAAMIVAIAAMTAAGTAAARWFTTITGAVRIAGGSTAARST